MKPTEHQELAELHKVQKMIEQRERRERIQKFVIAGLGALLLTSVITGHVCGCKKRCR